MKRIISLAVCIGFFLFSVSFALALPRGFRFEKGRGVKVSADIAKAVNVETRSLRRDEYITSYVLQLSSPEEEQRMWAAWALGNFQSQTVLEALFSRIDVENSDSVMNELYNDLCVNFGLYGWGTCSGFDATASSIRKKQIGEWRIAYEKYGYHELVSRGWRVAQKKGQEGVNMFVAGVTGRYDPKLIPELLAIYGDNLEGGLKDHLENTIVSWSGYDLKKHNISEVKKDLQQLDALSPENICKRCLLYFEQAGYEGLSPETVGLAVLYYEGDKTLSFRRDMALRILSCRTK
jgi:hypothetical protein